MSLSFLSRLPGAADAPPSQGCLQPPGISEEGWQGAPQGQGLPRQGFASSSPALFSGSLQAAESLQSLCVAVSRVHKSCGSCKLVQAIAQLGK